MKKRKTEQAADIDGTAFPHDPQPGSEDNPPPTNGEPAASLLDAALTDPDETSLGEEPSLVSESAVTPSRSALALEQRVSRLEAALAQIQDQRPRPEVATVPVVPAAQAVVVPMARVAPTAVSLNPPPTALVVAGAQLLANSVPRNASGRSIWLLFDIFAEGRTILRMYVDPRYSLSWFGRIVPVFLIVLYFTWTWWTPTVFSSLWLFTKVVDLLICFVLFKSLSHEARRYRQIAPDLPSSLRL